MFGYFNCPISDFAYRLRKNEVLNEPIIFEEIVNLIKTKIFQKIFHRTISTKENSSLTGRLPGC